VNQQKHGPALHDEVLYSHGPDLRTETNATRDAEKEDGLPVLGLFVIGPEKVRLRPDQDGLVFDGCLGHETPVHCPLCRPKNFYPPTCLVGPGERNQGFHVENPGNLGIKLPTLPNMRVSSIRRISRRNTALPDGTDVWGCHSPWK
jgi:hypothetical protein